MFTTLPSRLILVSYLILSFGPASRAEVERAATTPGTTPLRIEVDATDLPRRLVSSAITIPVHPGSLELLYPEWIQGTHAPTRQVANLAGLRIADSSGASIPWTRHSTDPYRFQVTVPEGASTLRVELRYIANQPNDNSNGVDCFGNAFLGVLNWNAVLVYPAGTTFSTQQVRASLRLPPGWKLGTALTVSRNDGERTEFDVVDLESLIDRPVICGAYLRSTTLTAKNAPPHRLHVVSESENSVRLDDSVKDALTALVEEAGAAFGGFPYARYDFLIVLSDELPRLGLEHLDSSLCVTKEESLVDEKVRKRDFDYLVAHEFVHAWCGKFRRPTSMIRENANTPLKTDLLWVYEGLTEYLSWILVVRSGLQSPNEFHETLAHRLGRLRAQHGLQWRSIEDTATASFLLRGGSPNWNLLRGSQEFYAAGALLWFEIDALLRSESLGGKSLTPFLQGFFKVSMPSIRVSGYQFDDVARALDQVTSRTWAEFLRTRTQRPRETQPLEFLGSTGYRLVLAPTRSDYLEDLEKNSIKPPWIDLVDSLGFVVNEEGLVRSLVPGGPADRARLFDGSKIIAVNARAFSRKRINDAVEVTLATGRVELTLREGDRLRNVRIEYADGPRFPRLVRDEKVPNLLDKIVAPLRDGAKNPESKSTPRKEP